MYRELSKYWVFCSSDSDDSPIHCQWETYLLSSPCRCSDVIACVHGLKLAGNLWMMSIEISLSYWSHHDFFYLSGGDIITLRKMCLMLLFRKIWMRIYFPKTGYEVTTCLIGKKGKDKLRSFGGWIFQLLVDAVIYLNYFVSIKNSINLVI